MRVAALLLSLLIAPTGAAFAEPASPIPPVIADTDWTVQSVAESHWTGNFGWASGEQRLASLYFRSDGVLVYAYDGNTYDNGRWIQRDRLITFQTNQYFAAYTGVTDGWTFAGSSYNINGDRGQFRFTRNAPRAP